MLKKLVLGPVMTNCYILWDDETKQGVVIDPADEYESIIQIINEENLQIKYIILTHTHYDHIQATAEVANLTGAKIAAHISDAPGLIDTTKSLGAFTGYDEAQKEADIILNDGDVLSVDNIELKIIHTPGHTVGGISILVNNMIFSGDTLFRGDVGRCDLPGGDFDTLKQSIEDKLMTLNDDIEVYPGHGLPSTIGDERRNNPYF